MEIVIPWTKGNMREARRAHRERELARRDFWKKKIEEWTQ